MAFVDHFEVTQRNVNKTVMDIPPFPFLSTHAFQQPWNILLFKHLWSHLLPLIHVLFRMVSLHFSLPTSSHLLHHFYYILTVLSATRVTGAGGLSIRDEELSLIPLLSLSRSSLFVRSEGSQSPVVPQTARPPPQQKAATSFLQKTPEDWFLYVRRASHSAL